MMMHNKVNHTLLMIDKQITENTHPLEAYGDRLSKLLYVITVAPIRYEFGIEALHFTSVFQAIAFAVLAFIGIAVFDSPLSLQLLPLPGLILLVYLVSYGVHMTRMLQRRTQELTLNTHSMGRSYLAHLIPREWWHEGWVRWLLYGVLEPEAILILGLTIVTISLNVQWVFGAVLGGYIIFASIHVLFINLAILRRRRKAYLAWLNGSLGDDIADVFPTGNFPQTGHRVQ
jgi:hypothetical protein